MKRTLTVRVVSSALSLCCRTISLVACSAVMLTAANAATVTVTVEDNGVNNIGAQGTFYWAITNAHASDTIAFNIPGAGVHYLKEPPNGFPLVYKKHNLLIDGYTQPGASPNTNAITQSNNAVIKIVIDGRNGNSRNMEYIKYDGTLATSDPPIDNTSMANEQSGFGSTERALLPIYRSTNVTVRGLAFLSTFNDPNGDQKGICFAHDYGLNTNILSWFDYSEGSDAYGHVCGCWFGVDPGNPTLAGVSGGLMAIANYRHRDINPGGIRPELPSIGLIVGVAPGSTNARAEFNVFVDYGYVMDSENIRARFSGNFVGVMPDGVTPYNMSEVDWTHFNSAGNGFFEWGRYSDTEPMIIGTDGDGVNDADEGNLFGPLALNTDGTQPNILDFYSTSRKAYIIAGNRFGIAVDGTRWTNSSFTIFGGLSLGAGTQVRFGSDFNGVSDSLEANVVYNNNVFATLYTNPPALTAPSLFQGMNNPSAPDAWVSIRGNAFVDNFPTFNPDDIHGTASRFVDSWSNFVAYTVDIPDPTNAIPTLSSNSTISTLIGTFGPTTTNGYTNLVLDLYLPDPEAGANGALFDMPTFGGTNGWGFVQGKSYLGSYLIPDPASGAFSLNISGLGLAHNTKVTAAITYSAFARPHITSITHTGRNTTLAWTGSNGGPFPLPSLGAPSSGFGVQRASSLDGPWTTTFAANNSITLSDTASTSFYRIIGPVSGMTTLFAPPVTLP